jgi:hypothetical protein
LDGASDELVTAVRDQHEVISDLVGAGADPGPLQDRWEAFEKAPSEDRAAAAAAFAATVEQDSKDHPLGAQSVGRAKVDALSRARKDWAAAKKHHGSVGANPLAMLTGSVGL